MQFKIIILLLIVTAGSLWTVKNMLIEKGIRQAEEVHQVEAHKRTLISERALTAALLAEKEASAEGVARIQELNEKFAEEREEFQCAEMKGLPTCPLGLPLQVP